MFEKEAEEIANKKLCSERICYNHCNFNSPKYHRCGEWHRIYDCAKESAEFGYNKANEWHYVKDGLPKTSGKYLVYTGGEPFILDFNTEVNSFGYWVVLFGDDWGVRDEDFETVKDRGEDEVIAWKEITLPKEIKEK